MAVVSPLRWDHAAASSAGLLGERYSFTPLSLPLPEGSAWSTLHGIHAVVGWGMTNQRLANVRRIERALSVEVLVPVGVVVEPGRASGKLAFSAGLTCRFLLF